MLLEKCNLEIIEDILIWLFSLYVYIQFVNDHADTLFWFNGGVNYGLFLLLSIYYDVNSVGIDWFCLHIDFFIYIDRNK